jgi:putative salt-induced outer membrane protein YdiY
MKYLTLLYFLLNFNAHAFLNIESLRQSNGEKEGLRGSIGLRLLDQSGNVDKSLIGLNTLNLLKAKKHQFIFLAKYRYGESFGDEDTREGHLHLRYTYDVLKSLKWELFQQSEFNKFQDLNSRFLLGTGVRMRVLNQDHHKINFGIGAFFESEEIENSMDQENPRLNNYLSYLYQAENFEFSSTLYYQPNTERFSDYRFRAAIGLETKIVKTLTQSLEYSYNRDTAPPVGIQRDDRILTAGLNYKY